MDQKLALIFFGLYFPSCCLFSQYYYVNLRMTWFEAQDFCRQEYNDLASFQSMDNITSLDRPNLVSALTWIGMRDDPATWKEMGQEATSWRWSSTGKTSKGGYSNWHRSHPNNMLGAFCVHINKLGEWIDWECKIHLTFICYDGNQSNIAYKQVSMLKTWTDAQAYCREFFTDLATIESSEENSKVVNIMHSAPISWIGLYRIPYSWSDKSQSPVRNWLPERPDNLFDIEQCACENILHEWEDFDCNARLTFLCIGDDNLPAIEVKESRKAMVKIKVQADSDLRKTSVSSQILEQLAEALASQGWINVTLQWRTKLKEQVEPMEKVEMEEQMEEREQMEQMEEREQMEVWEAEELERQGLKKNSSQSETDDQNET